MIIKLLLMCTIEIRMRLNEKLKTNYFLFKNIFVIIIRLISESLKPISRINYLQLLNYKLKSIIRQHWFNTFSNLSIPDIRLYRK